MRTLAGVRVQGTFAEITVPLAYDNIPVEMVQRGLTEDQAFNVLVTFIQRHHPGVHSFRVVGPKRARPDVRDESTSGASGVDPIVLIQ